MVPLTYRFFTDMIPKNNIKHSLSPYKVSYRPNRMSTKRSFHTSTRHAQRATSAIPHISLHIAAASSGKGRKYDPEKSTVDFVPDGTNTLPAQTSGNVYQRRRNRPDSGEDAYFVASVGRDTTTIALGVCDGVGGWQEQGINPADFSHGLCGYMAEHALTWPSTNKSDESTIENLHPKKLLHAGYDDTLADKEIRAGGATACVAVADGSGRMRTANLGDSGFVHIRLGAVHTQSPPQTHAFNTPYQLSKTPPEIMTQAAIFGGLPLNDSPDRADVADNQLQHGDIVIFATDGVWDNLSSQDVLTIVSQQMRDAKAWERTEKGLTVNTLISDLVQPGSSDKRNGASLQSVLASHIVGEAKAASMDRKRDGPFAKAVQREYPMDRWHGGKVDDITVLVLVAVENKQELKAKL
ncbi:Protein phosphatase 2C 7 [Lithohypha guttulata]|uniref:Protein phosphatase n=1 Tax=Lithohypha guttulata TaxID=1690604 RepID=A0AAN7T3Y5_9EURO|nr:Protein phosphatase 2C 7 [Lithohypha guttulata]KAK5087882.1 Protein phosphatase 2C 7 [Lithohypha guttulata]KAK5094947.1 Protein phosphatase 2C 7 [Lithohypha guttulata]